HIALIFLLPYYGAHRDLHSFPTRRSSDLTPPTLVDATATSSDLTKIFVRFGEPMDVATATAASNYTLSGGPTVLAASISTDKKLDRKSTRLNSSHRTISYAVFCLKKKKQR